MVKNYYKIEFRLISPLSVGSGDNEFSDKDVIKKSNGEPFIPGTSLAGVYRSLFSAEEANQYFGSTIDHGEEANGSCILVYDANPKTKNFVVSKRDGVGLDEYKTAIKGAKYDFETVEPGMSFVTYIEQNVTENNPEDITEKIVTAWKNKGLTFGAKTARGYGETKVVHVWRKTFDLSKQDGAFQWLKFNMYAEDNWCKEDEVSELTATGVLNNKILLNIALKQKGAISIRKYTTRVGTNEQPEPDYEQMTYVCDKEACPFIPGTSWAGAFRHHMKSVVPDLNLKSLFGELGNKSPIVFHESVIHGSVSKLITRNAIDRFSGGTERGALYTERTYYNGITKLTIEFPEKSASKTNVNALAISIADLHLGILSIGGLTTVGRGLFEITQIEIVSEGTSHILNLEPQDEQMPETAASRIYDFVITHVGR